MTRSQPSRQRGYAMIMLISMVTLVSSYLLANALTRTSAEIVSEQDRRTLDALTEAKAALIAYAASGAWKYSDSSIQPGGLPCPDANNDGTAESTCTTASSRIGRLPWKTIDLSDQRDASGERLWYGLSANFVKAIGTTTINSDTVGTLTFNGNTPATSVVAVIIAPGPAVQDTSLLPATQIQDRTSTNENRAASYLEDTNYAATDTYTNAAHGANGVYVSSATTYNSLAQSRDFFNDRIITITQAELMSAVEPAVAARIEKDVNPFLTTYASQWSGAYPFPASFPQTTNAQSAYSGSTSAQSGLLPLTIPSSYAWTAGSGAVTLVGGTAASVSAISCATYLTVNWRCSFTINGVNLGTDSANWGTCTNPSTGTTYRYCIISPILKVQGAIDNMAGRSFAVIPAASDVSANRTPITSPAISGTLSATGVGTVAYQATYGYSAFSSFLPVTRTITFTIPEVTVSALTSSSGADAGWFITQQWYRQTYYAVAPGRLPGGSGTCTAGTNCLTVSSLPSTYTSSNDKRAILILSGRPLGTSMTRPSSTLSDYLEGQNASPGDYVFEHRAGVATSINDRVIVIAP
jgi:hypothetical protein